MFANQDLYRLSISTISSNKQQIGSIEQNSNFYPKPKNLKIETNKVDLAKFKHKGLLIQLYKEGFIS